MAFREFTFPEVQHSLGLTLSEADLFRSIAAIELAEDFVTRMRGGVDLALAIDTEKARSEFIIAPILLGPRGRPGAVDWAGPATPAEAPRIAEPQWEVCGSDAHVFGQLVYPDA